MFQSATIRKDKEVVQPLPEQFKEILNQLAKDLGAKGFILYGGAALDLLIDPSQEFRDLDVAILSDTRDTKYFKDNLRRSGYEILGPDREYYLNVIDPVTIVFSQNDRWVLDMALLGNVLKRKIDIVPPSAFHTSMDKFDIDSVFWRYPQLDVVDLYDSFGALRNKTMRPIYSLYEENPYLLVNRMISMCAKYGLDICNNPIHKRTFEILAKRISQWKHPGKFHGKFVKIAHYSTVLKAIKRAKDKQRFIADLVDSRILEFTMPELQKGLNNNVLTRHLSVLSVATTKQDVAKILIDIVDEKERNILKKRFNLLGLRTWDLEDQAVISSNMTSG